jgi:hypothetical protein
MNEPYQPPRVQTPQSGGYPVNTGMNPGTETAPPTPVNEEDNLDMRIAAAVEARVSKIASDYDRKIRSLEERQNRALKDARGIRPVDHLVPTHAGGPDNDIHETWGQYYQELSAAGLLTDAHIATTNGLVPPETEMEAVDA